MTGATTPCPTEAGSQPLRCRSVIPGLEPIVLQSRSDVAPQPDPRLRASLELNGALPVSLAARLQILAPVESGLTTFLDELESLLRSQRTADISLDEDVEMDVDMPPGLAPVSAPQAHMQALVRDFSRRQRQASMVVAGCVATSCVLTVIGMAAVASLALHGGKSEDRLPGHANATAWAPAPDAHALTLTAANPNRSGKSDSLFVSARLAAAEPRSVIDNVLADRHPSAPALILMQPGIPVSLAPIIAPRRASYVLIRGLPAAATLSAGKRSPSGGWLVKAEEVGSLSLTIDGEGGGDYTAEIYAVGAQALPQGRQRVVFRVAPELERVAAESFNWAITLRDMAMTNAPGQVGDAGADVPNARRLLDDGTTGSSGVFFERISDAGAAAPRRVKILASLSD